MVLGADIGKETQIPIYEAQNSDLSEWKFQGILFRLPQEDLRFFECPNFFKVDGKWILLCSPYKALRYFVGSFDIDSYTFTPERRGILDPGGADAANFYASNTLYDKNSRCILFGWVRGFKEGLGWNGCLALPRVLTIGKDGRPRQNPVPELESLRNGHIRYSAVTVSNGNFVLDDISSDTLELTVNIEPDDSKNFGLHLRQSSDGKSAVTVAYNGEYLDVAGTKVP